MCLCTGKAEISTSCRKEAGAWSNGTAEASLPTGLLAAHHESPAVGENAQQVVSAELVAFGTQSASNSDVEARGDISWCTSRSSPLRQRLPRLPPRCMSLSQLRNPEATRQIFFVKRDKFGVLGSRAFETIGRISLPQTPTMLQCVGS